MRTGRVDEPIFIKDSELVHGCLPVMSSVAPIGSNVAQCQPDELRHSVIGREVAAGLDDFTLLRVEGNFNFQPDTADLLRSGFGRAANHEMVALAIV
ncbi:hypothetical protein WT83_16725 [Burkholderia territorii]|uniref:Uncharacterized protein n=1 Tax=Burkholderia territorii TaxID=1503055 RepID=A0A108EP50_9BURK|nr:hypothetical protein WT83_16725 [Burkholderia territorii]